ncbi:MAG: hypothetical protein PWR29_1930, partial [Methanolobus sp.]|nr:hypothetical protein [Methanolobus sp.]
MNILYVAPDIPIPHTGSFVGGSTHVMKVAESLIKKGNKVYVLSRRESKQVKYEEINSNFFTRRIYRGLMFPVNGGIQSDNQKISLLWALTERFYFLVYRVVLVFFAIYLLRKYK